MRAGAVCATAFLTMLTHIASALAGSSAAGIWEQTNDDGQPTAWVAIAERSGLFSARYVRVFPDFMKEWRAHCEKCSDAIKKEPIIGSILMYGMQRNGSNYENGHVVDIGSANVYKLRLFVTKDDEIGYYGYNTMFCDCHVQLLHRVTDEAARAANVSNAMPPD
jgi:Uncharacterized protein conserved in bacteria (DUF2147)